MYPLPGVGVKTSRATSLAEADDVKWKIQLLSIPVLRFIIRNAGERENDGGNSSLSF